MNSIAPNETATKVNPTDDEIEIENQEELELNARPHQMGTNTEVRIAKEQSSVFELLRKEKNNTLVLAPDFQRIDVWDKKHQSELIESVLMGIPIPLIYLFEDENGIRQIIDGKQRITALKRYLEGQFSLTSLTMLPQLSGKKFDDIPPVLQAKLEDYQLHCYVIQPPTPELVKFNIFERVNRGGVNLNKQEMRHALYQGKSTELIRLIAESPEFQTATGGGVKSNRMRDRYLVLRFVGFYLRENNLLSPQITYHSNIDAFLALVMRFLNTKAPDTTLDTVKQACLKGLKNVHSILGNEAFRFTPKSGGNRRPINMGLFETLVFAFEQLDLSTINPEEALHLVEQAKLKIEDEGLFSGSIDTTDNVRARFEIANYIVKELNYA